MENNDYEYDTEDEEETQSENFFVNFYNNNKVLIWIFGGIVIFILLLTLFTKGSGGGSGNNDTTPGEIEYGVTIYPEGDVYVNVGRSTNLIASIKNDPKGRVEWSVEDANIVRVDNGNVTGLDYGITTVTATYIDGQNNKYNDTKKVIVADGDPSITLQDATFKQGDLFMSPNSTYKIALVLTPARGYVENEKFTTSNSSVATVDRNGLVTAVAPGEAVISVVVNGKFSKELRVHVGNDYNGSEIIVVPDRIDIDGELRKIKIGTSERLSYSVTPPSADVDRLVWTSSDESVVTVDNGVVTGNKVGSAVIKVTTVTGISDEINVEVENDIIDVKSIDLSISKLELEIGESKTINPEVSPADASNKALSYTSLDQYVAFVDPNDTGTQATITGISEGETTIVIESNNGIKEQLMVVVTDPNGLMDEEDFDPEEFMPSYDIEPSQMPSGSGGSGGSSGSSGGQKQKGFDIVSIDSSNRADRHYVTNDYSGGENNEAIGPVRITITKTDASIEKLVVECDHQTYEITDKETFIVRSRGEFTIKITQVYSDGSEVVFNRYLRIKSIIDNPDSSQCEYITDPQVCANSGNCYWDVFKCHPNVGTITCSDGVNVGGTIRCSVDLVSGGTVTSWSICGKTYDTSNTTQFSNATGSGDCWVIVYTTNGKAYKKIHINGSSADPTPGGSGQESQYLNNCMANSNGDCSVKVKKGETITLTTKGTYGINSVSYSSDKVIVKNPDKLTITIKGENPVAGVPIIVTFDGGHTITVTVTVQSPATFSYDGADITPSENGIINVNIAPGIKKDIKITDGKIKTITPGDESIAKATGSAGSSTIKIEGIGEGDTTIPVKLKDGAKFRINVTVTGYAFMNPALPITCNPGTSIKPYGNTICEVSVPAGDEIKTWYQDGVDQQKKDNPMTFRSVTGVEKSWTWVVETKKGLKSSVVITVSNENPSKVNIENCSFECMNQSITCDQNVIMTKGVDYTCSHVRKGGKTKYTCYGKENYTGTLEMECDN